MKHSIICILLALLLVTALPFAAQAAEPELAATSDNPMNVRATVNADHTVSVIWDKYPNTDHYVVNFCNKDDASGSFYQVSSGKTVSSSGPYNCLFEAKYSYAYGWGGDDYRIKVYAYNNKDVLLTRSDSAVFQTGLSALGSPEPVAFDGYGVLSCAAVSNAEVYDMRVFTENGVYAAQANSANPSHDFTEKLTVGEKYYFSVTAKTPVSKAYRDSKTVQTELFTVQSPAADTVTVTGTVNSFLDPAEAVTVTLSQLFGNSYTKTFTGNSTTFSIPNVKKGSYFYTVKKKNHATYGGSITAGGLMLFYVTLHPLGDINGDGQITTVDFGKANSHARGKSTLEGYEFTCADINSDSSVSTADAGKINSHARGKTKLW